ncbi:TatD-related deoxyribonuclease [Pyrobaculum islandicum DSM 4184]|uniref:TatD-related deoxyribonuclease n=1 Tax=Pyrobaculum islandicum (strain DSM 4184 / JCM 9189 / GEO3) TaxID=384616 RepID=A1RVL0_PYRIL|nr:TatD family hydrolase [Pyrobaculum islandicum]ABL88992.1 TatD-related deoxyribonuclease [Pyrobaculum islandicum DSM 4184]
MAVGVFDNHTHANEFTGFGAVEVARRFKAAGGVGLVFVSLLTWSIGGVPGDRGWVVRLYDHTVRNAEVARGVGLVSGAVVGVHPAECVRLLEAGWGVGEVEEFMRWAVDLAARYVEEGRAVGMGEFGRPHWPVGEEVVELCNRVLLYVFERARDVGAVVHLHLERRGRETVDSIAALVAKAGVDPARVVMHHIEGALAGYAYARGLSPSVPLGRRGEFEDALRAGPVFVVESDYLDDKSRPGAVIPPWTLASKLRQYVAKGVLTEDDMYKICVENVRRIYKDRLDI